MTDAAPRSTTPGPRWSARTRAVALLRGARLAATRRPRLAVRRPARFGQAGRGPGLRRRPARRRPRRRDDEAAADPGARRRRAAPRPRSWSSGSAPPSRVEQADEIVRRASRSRASRATARSCCSTSSTSSSPTSAPSCSRRSRSRRRARSSSSWPTSSRPSWSPSPRGASGSTSPPLPAALIAARLEAEGVDAGRGRRGGGLRRRRPRPGPPARHRRAARPPPRRSGATCPAASTARGARPPRCVAELRAAIDDAEAPLAGPPRGRGGRAAASGSSATASGARAPRSSRPGTSARAGGCAPTSCASAWAPLARAYRDELAVAADPVGRACGPSPPSRRPASCSSATPTKSSSSSPWPSACRP